LKFAGIKGMLLNVIKADIEITLRNLYRKGKPVERQGRKDADLKPKARVAAFPKRGYFRLK